MGLCAKASTFASSWATHHPLWIALICVKEHSVHSPSLTFFSKTLWACLCFPVRTLTRPQRHSLQNAPTVHSAHNSRVTLNSSLLLLLLPWFTHSNVADCPQAAVQASTRPSMICSFSYFPLVILSVALLSLATPTFIVVQNLLHLVLTHTAFCLKHTLFLLCLPPSTPPITILYLDRSYLYLSSQCECHLFSQQQSGLGPSPFMTPINLPTCPRKS